MIFTAQPNEILIVIFIKSTDMKSDKLIIFMLLLSVLSSCDKPTDDFTGNHIDENIIGTWSRTFSTRDANNSITLFADTIEFRSDNTGNQRIFAFDQPWHSYSFQFYTQDSILYIMDTGSKNSPPRSFSIQNDSLTLMGGIPYIKLN